MRSFVIQNDESKDIINSMSYSIYILRFSNNSLYIGQTNNIDQRLKDHQSKTSRAAKFSKENGEFKLVYSENYSTLLEAMQRCTE